MSERATGRTEPAADAAGTISRALIQSVCARVAVDQRVTRKLPGAGRIHVERQLPFLYLYRRPVERPDAGTERLVTSTAAYVVAPADRRQLPGLARLLRALVQTLSPAFGAFLVLELWSSESDEPDDGGPRHVPWFRIHAPRGGASAEFVASFAEALSRVSLLGAPARVELVWRDRCHATFAGAVLSTATADANRCTLLGLEVRPVFRDAKSGVVYPALLRELRAGLTRALRQAIHNFTCTQTTHCPAHYHVLGPRALVRSVWEVDRQLAAVAERFDFLLQVTPVNAESAWAEFRRSRYARAPVFHYRPLPVEPISLKRQLYRARVERVDDPAMSHLFRGKLDELDRQVTLLQDVNTSRFVHGSIQLFGGVDDALLALAHALLSRLPRRDRAEEREPAVDARGFAGRAAEEFAYYRERLPGFDATVAIRDDIVSGLMVSHGNLLVGRDVQIPGGRVEALLQHEVGTHVLTYYNGRSQPFRQLCAGLAGYDPLQEGIAVLAEYLVGGLSRARLRLLAGRVVAARRMIDGAEFPATYSELVEGHGFGRETAFTIAMRVYRGGGLTKDAAYLRGLQQVLEYLGSGGTLRPLLVGKIAAEHIPIIRELHWREVLREPPLTPRYFDRPDAMRRLEELRAGRTVLDLI